MEHPVALTTTSQKVIPCYAWPHRVRAHHIIARTGVHPKVPDVVTGMALTNHEADLVVTGASADGDVLVPSFMPSRPSPSITSSPVP
jgi:hypothetical protein